MLQIPYEVFRHTFNPFQNHLSSSRFGKQKTTHLPTNRRWLPGTRGNWYHNKLCRCTFSNYEMGTIILIVCLRKLILKIYQWIIPRPKKSYRSEKKAIWRILEIKKTPKGESFRPPTFFGGSKNWFLRWNFPTSFQKVTPTKLLVVWSDQGCVSAFDKKNHSGGNQIILGGGFKYFWFSLLLGEDFQFDEYFSDGLKPPTSIGNFAYQIFHLPWRFQEISNCCGLEILQNSPILGCPWYLESR